MKGFFSKKEVKRSKPGRDNLSPCERCKLHEHCRTPYMTVQGEGRSGVLIIGESPDQEEDEGNQYYQPGTTFIGEAGRMLREKLQRFELDLDTDFWRINAINCVRKGKKITRKQIKCCREYYVDELIERLNPRMIWLLGGPAVESIYADRFSNLGISRWRGLLIPDKKWQAWVVPMHHPSFLLRTKKKTKRGYVYYDKNLESLIDRDLEQSVNWLEEKVEPPEFPDYSDKVKLVTKIKPLLKHFRLMRKSANTKKKIVTAFDFETSALKPFNPINKIWCMSIAYAGKSFSFPIDYENWSNSEYEKVVNEVNGYLTNQKIKKVAHNMKFEDVWSRTYFKQRKLMGWLWCSMNAAHIIDARKFFTGLKFQSFINFGIEGYESKIKPFMKTRPGSFINRLNEVPLPDLLMYCGLDALLTRKLYFLQRKVIRNNSGLKDAYDLTHKGLLAFADTQLRGFPVDDIYYMEEEISIGEKMDEIEEGLMNDKWAKKFLRKFKRQINLDSTKDLILLFKDIIKVKLEKKTEKGNIQMTAEVLEDMDNPFAKRIVKLRKLKKIKNTYMKQITQEISAGHIHAFIDLHIPRSYRSSASNPNLQNVPTREEEAKKSTRSGFKPEHGCRLLFGDYGSQEVRIIGCYTQDENLMEYLHDETTDMHRDQAKNIFVLDDDSFTKDLRFYTKNQFVFPEFYGSYYVSCARNMYHLCMDMETAEGMPVWEHLEDKGVMSSRYDYEGFENHVKEVEQEFWNTFPGVREWQNEGIAFYQQHGYVETMFGYRRGGLLTPNMIINTPIQATAFHCLLWSYIKLNAIAKRQYRSRPIFQIHDEIVWNLYPDEEKEVIKKMRYIMERKIRSAYDFLIVPLECEVEITDIDQSWYTKYDYKEAA